MIYRTMPRVALAVAALGFLGACAGQGQMEALEARVAELEGKTDLALQKAAEAGVDARTALFVANQ